MNVTDVNPMVLARKFSALLRNQLTARQMEAVVSLNKQNGVDKNTCASHDFCDANMVMLEALAESGAAAEFNPADEAHCKIWNEAWSIARNSDFNPHTPQLATYLAQRRSTSLAEILAETHNLDPEQAQRFGEVATDAIMREEAANGPMAWQSFADFADGVLLGVAAMAGVLE